MALKRAVSFEEVSSRAEDVLAPEGAGAAEKLDRRKAMATKRLFYCCRFAVGEDGEFLTCALVMFSSSALARTEKL